MQMRAHLFIIEPDVLYTHMDDFIKKKEVSLMNLNYPDEVLDVAIYDRGPLKTTKDCSTIVEAIFTEINKFIKLNYDRFHGKSLSSMRNKKSFY